MMVFSNIVECKNFMKNDDNKLYIYNTVIEEIEDALLFNYKFFILFKSETENLKCVIFSDNWENILQKGLEYFEKVENYEKCIELHNLKIIVKDYLS